MAQQSSRTHRVRDRRAPDQTLHFGVSILRGIGTFMSSSLANAIEDGNHSYVAEASINPLDYESTDAFYLDYFAVNLLRKSVSLNLNVDRVAAAMKGFHASEQSCATINYKLARPFATPSIGVTTESYLHTAQQNIAKLLGDFDWNAAEAHFSFSSGASTRQKRMKGDAFYKYSGKPETTLSCFPLAVAAVKCKPLWHASMVASYGDNPYDWFTIVGGSKITTVPKTAKVDRVIAIEPCMNMYVQKGIGFLIRDRLKRVGIDLNDQTRNQLLAEAAYSSHLSTIDLASASDSISLGLVERLLPPDWFKALCLSRSEACYLPDGLKHPFSKISSMGNGYTFELESLIFWALSRSVIQISGESDTRLGVYGDDIILSRRCAPTLIDVLDYCGFTCNIEKTFIDGCFFESCGKHYFKGVDVTPVYVKDPVADDSRLIWLANSIRRWAARPTPGYADGRFFHLHAEIVSAISPRLQGFRIPDGFGDGALIGSFDEIRPAFQRSMYIVKVLLDRRKKHRPDGPAACLAYFQGSEVGQSDDYYYIVDRAGKGRFSIATLKLSQWADAPHWCV